MPRIPPITSPIRTASWLIKNKCGPTVFAFRNIESGQVVFSQTLHPTTSDIASQFQFANWQNKLPTTRKDVWRPMAVAELPDHKSAVRFYVNLIKLRYLRDREQKSLANSWRKKSDDGNIWYYWQFRPTYTQEAVADIASAIEAENQSGSKSVTIHWENEWRKGDDKHWQDVNVQHEYLPKHNPREKFVVLKHLADKIFERVSQGPAASAATTSAPAAETAATTTTAAPK